MKPIWHKLVTGGVGEVIPAEILQGVVKAQHDAVDLLAGDHVLDWRGLPVHDDLRWPKAVAKIQIIDEFRDAGYSIDEVDQRLLFAEGFSEPPTIKGDRRPISLGGNPVRGWWVDWKLNSAGRQAAMIGFEVKNLSVPLETPRLIDLGATPGHDARRADDEGRGQAFLGMYDVIVGEEGEVIEYVLSDHLKNISAITILIR